MKRTFQTTTIRVDRFVVWPTSLFEHLRSLALAHRDDDPLLAWRFDAGTVESFDSINALTRRARQLAAAGEVRVRMVVPVVEAKIVAALRHGSALTGMQLNALRWHAFDSAPAEVLATLATPETRIADTWRDDRSETPTLTLGARRLSRARQESYGFALAAWRQIVWPDEQNEVHAEPAPAPGAEAANDARFLDSVDSERSVTDTGRGTDHLPWRCPIELLPGLGPVRLAADTSPGDNGIRTWSQGRSAHGAPRVRLQAWLPESAGPGAVINLLLDVQGWDLAETAKLYLRVRDAEGRVYFWEQPFAGIALHEGHQCLSLEWLDEDASVAACLRATGRPELLVTDPIIRDELAKVTMQGAAYENATRKSREDDRPASRVAP